jgi:hypothetical protein
MLASIPVVMAVPGCQGRECESDGYKDYGYGPGEGHLVDANTWESTPDNANWLAFGPYHSWGFHPVGLEGRDFVLIATYISADPNPTVLGSNFTEGAGNGVIVNPLQDSRTVIVTNATCAPTYVRVVIQADPFPPTANLDGGTSAAIGVSDSGASDEAGTGDLDAGDASD